MALVYFAPGAWCFLQEAIAEGKLASVRSCLERATKKHGDRIVACQDSDVEELRAFLDRQVRDAQARKRQMLEGGWMNEGVLWDLQRATEAQRALDEATGPPS
ncbi:MAG: hypothetical protein ACRELZ_12070 [Candidatus Rokuibacteriota bacterium]